MSNKSRKQPNDQGVRHRDVNASERATMAIDLLKQRISYDEIAKRCGYSSRQSAHKAVQRELQRRIVPKIDEYRQQELDILDEIHRRVWEVAFPVVDNSNKDKDNINKDKKEYKDYGDKINKKKDNEESSVNLWAVDRLLELSRDRRKLLNLDVQPEESVGPQLIIREVPAGLLPSPTVEAGQ